MTDIDFTFGIITNSANGVNPMLLESIESIKSLNIPNYEIIVVGGGSNKLKSVDGIKAIDFDESVKRAWITKKKNMITSSAKYENIVYTHDYIKFNDDWYNGWKKFGSDYNIAMNKMINFDGTRYRDWSIFPHRGLVERAKRASGFRGHECLLPYDEKGFSKLQYISGAYWVAKKPLMNRFRLNEGLVWGEGEDVEWSYKVRNLYNFTMNPHSSVSLLKPKNVTFTPMRPEVHKKMKDFLIREKQYG